MTVLPPPSVTSLATFALEIRTDKFSAYLLNPDHPQGGSKAAFFVGLGFSLENPSQLSDALVEQAWNAQLIRSRPHPRGYGIEVSAIGPISGPNGRSQ